MGLMLGFVLCFPSMVIEERHLELSTSISFGVTVAMLGSAFGHWYFGGGEVVKQERVEVALVEEV
jgi:hypothetical protein